MSFLGRRITLILAFCGIMMKVNVLQDLLVKEAFRAVTENDILQPYMADHDFRFSNIRVEDVAFILYLSDIRCQQKSTASQPINQSRIEI